MIKSLLAVLLALSLAATAVAAPPDGIPARVSTAGSTANLLLRDQPLKLRTDCGTVVLPLQDIHTIARPSSDLRARLETTLGDVWRVEWRTLSGTLQIHDGTGFRRLDEEAPEFDHLEINPRSAVSPAAGMVHVQLTDDQQVVVTPAEWTFDIPDKESRWSLPMGSVQSLARKNSRRTADWTVVFPSGVKAKLPEPPRNRLLNATDRLANALQIPLDEVLRLDAIAAAEPAAARTHTNPQTHAIDDLVPADAMPFVVLRVTGALGDVSLPTAMLNSVAPRAGGGIQATTVYGEHFLGTVEPQSLTLPDLPDRGTVTVTLNRDSLAWHPERHLALPPGTLLWQLEDGNLIAARFADDTLTLADPHADAPTSIPTSNIVAVLNHGTRLTLRDSSHALHYGRPTATRIALTIQLTGRRHELPWSQVNAIDQHAPPATTNTAATTGPRDGMLRIAGGPFLMGRTHGEGLPDELPPHALTMPDFYMDPYEITRAQFADFVAATRYRTEAELAGQPATWREPDFLQRQDEPVIWVSWHDAAQYCNWRSTAAGLKPCYTFSRRGQEVTSNKDADGYRLPTEAEWEYAARGGGTDRLYPWGDDTTSSNLPAYANFSPAPGAHDDGWLWTNPVLSFPPNNLGLYGMAGNVWEWCEDWYFDRAYSSVHRQRPSDPSVRTGDVAGLNRRTMRGGSFDSELELLRCVARGHGLPQASANRVGFRCVRSIPPGADQP